MMMEQPCLEGARIVERWYEMKNSLGFKEGPLSCKEKKSCYCKRIANHFLNYKKNTK
jgi:hypothetical protein